MTRLVELASVLRSKNAGPFLITIDVFFPDRATLERVRSSGVLEPAAVAEVYGIPADGVTGPFWDIGALGVKVSFPKIPSTADPACTDVFGAHQHVPLAETRVP